MRRGVIEIDGLKIPVIESKVCIVGSGAAALNAAVHLKRLGVGDLVIVTERLGGGTSANAGSDKQTYFRVNPAAGTDGIGEMAKTLFSGGSMHGDIALVEAALSEREFFHLTDLGVPFPYDRHGIYPGYRTDHDSKGRGTSAGPKTSIMMFERLLDEVGLLGIPIIDNVTVIELVTEEIGERISISGLLCLEHSRIEKDDTFGIMSVMADYVVYAVGGAAALYRDSVYPEDQVGGLGPPLKAGAATQNLTESQFGVASIDFRWNLSGSYQQVLPRYISTDENGDDEREFLSDGYPDADRLFTAQFLKGYEWPFDVKKISSFGSSLIDIFVFNEIINKERRVFLDYTKNPSHSGSNFKPSSSPAVVREYLTASGATGDTPIERLLRLNKPAYELFLQNGIDLVRDRVPIAVCHQHINGGLVGSIWWETNIQNFFSVGECNGSHGIYRPGGSALNAGQVGSLRAAQMIAHRIETENGAQRSCEFGIRPALERLIVIFSGLFKKKPHIDPIIERKIIQRRMSEVMGIVRSTNDIADALKDNRDMIEAHRSGGLVNRGELLSFVRNEDLLITERAFLASAKFLLDNLSGPRGSYLVERSIVIKDLLDDALKNKSVDIAPDESLNDRIVECTLDENLFAHTRFVPVRPIPNESIWFEAVWAAYREGAVYREKSINGGS